MLSQKHGTANSWRLAEHRCRGNGVEELTQRSLLSYSVRIQLVDWARMGPADSFLWLSSFSALGSHGCGETVGWVTGR